MIKKLILPIVTLSTLWTGAFAESGGNGSGGADFQSPQTWFESQTLDRSSMPAIKTCLVTSKDFGLSDFALRQLTQSAAKTWSDYIAEIEKSTNSLTYNVNTNFVVNTVCDGSEDLKIYFGVRDENVNIAAGAYAQPLAFAHRSSQPRHGWSKGLIYIASATELKTFGREINWSVHTERLESVLVHEIGHVLGIGHVPGTVMSSDFATKLYDYRYSHPPFIDQDRQLYICSTNCAVNYVAPKENFDGTNGDWAPKSFEIMTGRKPKQIEQMSFQLTFQKGKSLPVGVLTYKDSHGTFKFPVVMNQITNWYDANPILFGRRVGGDDQGVSYIGKIKKANGEVAVITANRNNANSGIFEINLLVEGDEFGQPLILVNSKFSNQIFFGHD